MSIRTGTSNFASFKDAVRYYARLEDYNTLRELKGIVQEKISDGTISLGKPDAPEGSMVVIDSKEGRYFIVDKE